MKRRADEFVPTNKIDETVETLENLREQELLDFLDEECCATAREANRHIIGITAHYNNLIKAILDGADPDLILEKAIRDRKP